MTDPVWKEHTFKVMEQAPEAKCVSLLAQVMDEFKELSPAQKDAIAQWFGGNYRRDIIGPDEIYVEGVDRPLTYKTGEE